MPDGEGVLGGSPGVDEMGKADDENQPSSPILEEEVTVLAPSGKPPGKVRKRRKLNPNSLERRQREDPFWQVLESRIGGREGFLAASVASDNPKAAEFTALLLDKNHRTWGTKALAKKAGLTVTEVIDMFRNQKWLEATINLHNELPAIVKDAADDAKASWVPCDHCRATKIDPETKETCHVCSGKGQLRKPGDKDKLKFVGEAAGMVKSGGASVQTNVQVNVAGPPAGDFESLMKQAALKLKPKVVDVEKV